MKIVYIIYSISNLTGIERMFVSQMNFLAEHYGDDVTLLTYDQGDAADGYPLSEKVNHLDFNIKKFHIYRYPRCIHPLVLWKWNRKLRRCITSTVTDLNPDIVVCSSYEISEMRIVLSLKHVKRVVQIHSSYLQSGGGFRTRHIEKSIVLWYKRNILFHRIVGLVHRFDKIVTLTQGDAELWNSPKVSVIPNSLVIKSSIGRVVREKKVVAVGSLLMVKGFDMLLEVWRKIYRKHMDWHLEITGEGLDESYLLEQMSDMPNVRILPRTRDIADRYLSGEIFAMTSRFEGFGLVLLEAMSFGLAPAAFDCDFGPREIITEGVDGFLVPVGDIDRMAERIEYLMDHDNVRHQMAAAAVEKSKIYHPDKIMPQFEQLYKSLIEPVV
jgi:glycosyltransferase involved in cell wall biosynthesis